MSTVGNHEVTLTGNQGKDPYRSFDFKINPNKSYGFNIQIYRQPTNNCQLSCVGSAYHLAQYFTTKKEVSAVLMECYRIIGYIPNLILMDVRAEFSQRLESLVQVQNKITYVSTNGSSMCLYLVKL